MKNILPLVICMALCSCGATKKASKVEYKTLDSITVSAKNNPYDIYRASRPRFWDITHTRVALFFNLQARTAKGKAWIRLHPYFYATDSLLLDAKSMDIDSVMLYNGTHYTPLSFTYHDDKLKIDFGRTYTREESVELFIKYTALPYAEPTGGSKAITEDRGLYFINTNQEVPGKPVQIWTQGETESNSHWLPTLDQPNERMTVQIELTVPDSFKTLSNGALIKREVAGKDMRTDVWAIQQPVQVYAIMFAIGDFSIVEDRSWNGVKVNYYVEPQFAPYAKKMFNNTPEMISYFSKITGVFYPWNKYSQVVVRDYVSGAMENTTASLFGEFMNQNFREIADRNYEDIVSHELFHQWFGDYVTAESWSNLTVNESFANYGEQLWRSYKYGKASNDELAFNDLNKYLNQTEYNDEPLVRFHYANHEDMFDRISYEKGGAILRYIHGLAGDEAFFRAMNIYLTKNALQPAEAHHWRLALEEATGKDWNWFFNQWYYRGGHPELDIQYDYNDQNRQLTVNVQQAREGSAYLLPLKAALIYGDKKEIVDWVIDSKKQSFTYPYKNGTKPLFIPDTEHWLVGIIKEKKTTQQWLEQLRRSDDYINKRRAVSSAFLAQGDTIAQRIFHEALKDSLEGIRVHTLSLLAQISDKNNWRKNFKEEIISIATHEKSNRVRAAALDISGRWKIETMKNELITALNDSSYMVAGAALEALRLMSKDTAYAIARNILEQEPKAELENAAWSAIALKGESTDMNLFRQRAAYVYGTKKISLASYLNLYIVNTKDINAYEEGLQILTNLAKNESIKSYRFAIGAMVFGMSYYYKEQAGIASGAEKVSDAKRRKEIADKYKKLVLSQETDPENIKRYNAM